jgi:L-seryl-tRNA(Ser) seleniumtransferase
VDAAAQLPPKENLWRFTHMGADLVLFSGGKGLCGPQSSGLILGRKDLVQACAFHACPRPFIGRPMKAGKEEIVGLMTAVRWYLDLDQQALIQTYENQVAMILAAFVGIPHVRACRSFPSEAGQPMPRAELIFEDNIAPSRDAILQALLQGEPAISLAASGECGIYINPQTLQAGEAQIIVDRLKEVLGLHTHL